VASAVKSEKIYELVGAARAFLNSPSVEFFFPQATTPYPVTELQQNFSCRGSDCLLLTFKPVKAVPDVIWGQLYRTHRALRKMLEINDFKVLRDAVWSDEENLACFVFELEKCLLSGVKKHVGPPLEYELECADFLQKYARNECVLAGPYIEAGRWIVEVKRKHTDAAELLGEKVRDGGKNAGVADLIAQAIKNNYRVVVNGEVSEIYAGNRRFAEFLTEFLRGKPFWLEPKQT
jgi:tRNA nucleotidyltransferase (CCA-adding enzyme)